MLSPHRAHVFVGCLAILLLVVFLPRQLEADHSWGKYHWDGDALPLQLDVGDNLSAEWTGHLASAVYDWNHPTGAAVTSLNLQIVLGSTDPATCEPTPDRIEVCNAAYGDNGWLGLARIWASRRTGHIAQATTLLNDTYFVLPFYNTDAWRRTVTCQEIAHDFGLDHQDEDFYNYNLGTCMDYSVAPAGGWFDGVDYGPDNTMPNQHDYDQIETMYAHIGGGGGGGGGRGGGGGGGRGRGGIVDFPDLPEQALQRVPIDSPAAWGLLVRQNGRFALYELDLGNDIVLFTFVTWAS